MWEKVTPFQGKSQCYGVELHAIWDVKADKTYDIHWPEQKDDKIYPGSIAMCYTLEGTGQLHLKQGSPLQLNPDSLLFSECGKIERYFCQASHWRFHWVEFSSYGTLPVPMHECIEVPHYQTYSRSFYELTHAIRQNTLAHRHLAAATFTKLIYQWGAHCEDRAANTPHLSRIQAIIGEMHSKISENWAVSDMARMANMSEVTFRQTFRNVTGQSPKKFYSGIRLAMTESLLRKGTLTITEIAEQLGYSDPFHLSKEFKKRFGVSPSTVKGK